jgi:hypothetical protein
VIGIGGVAHPQKQSQHDDCKRRGHFESRSARLTGADWVRLPDFCNTAIYGSLRAGHYDMAPRDASATEACRLRVHGYG